MINGINSYSNYNYTNTFSNTTSNTKSSNAINEASNLVSDKSQAVDKILGYGVDKEGFFTSDFNEAADLPKDYKIYAKDMQSFVEWETGDRYFYATHTSIDIAKTIGNAYKVLSQIMPTTSNASLSEEELTNIPYAFVLDKNLNVTKTFTKDEYEKIDLTQDRINLTFNTFSNTGFDKISIDNIFSHSNGDVRLNKNAYINKDGSVDKGGVLMALLNSQLYGATSLLLEGDTRLFGKITTDKNISNDEREAFQNFMNANKIQSAFSYSSNLDEWNPFEERLSMKLFIRRSNNIGNDKLSRLAMDLDKEYQEMINSNMSLEEFKTKYLDFKQRHDEFVKSLKEAEKAKGIDYDKYPTGKPIDDTKAIEEAQKKRKPIQAESKSETYKDDNKMNELLKKLLETKFSTSDELEILFGMKFSDDDTGEFNKILSLNSAPKSIDIKA
ncbi:TPA: Cj0814 family flagellar-dependent secreted protein [Campylobacter coli]